MNISSWQYITIIFEIWTSATQEFCWSYTYGFICIGSVQSKFNFLVVGDGFLVAVIHCIMETGTPWHLLNYITNMSNVAWPTSKLVLLRGSLHVSTFSMFLKSITNFNYTTRKKRMYEHKCCPSSWEWNAKRKGIIHFKPWCHHSICSIFGWCYASIDTQGITNTLLMETSTNYILFWLLL